MRTYRSRSNRGQAAVELSLLGILIIPTFLYIIFLDDLLRYKQDQQEAMVAAGWDFTTLNWDHQTLQNPEYYLPNKGTPANQADSRHESHVSFYNRMAYSDHTAATPRFDDPTADLSEKHHLGVGAHQCWLVGETKNNQVTCTQVDVNIAANFTVDGTVNGRTRLRDFVSQGTGGLYQCKGRVGVVNNFLPSGVLFFSKEELSSRKFHGKFSDSGSIDFDGKNTHSYRKSAEAYHFPFDTFAVVTHPWAMTDQEDVSPTNSPRLPATTSGVPLYDRVVQIYNSVGPIAAIGSATIYPVKAIQQQLISPAVIIDQATPVSSGDLMLTPEVAFRKAYDPTVNGYQGGTFYSSQYWDFQSNDVRTHYNNRGTWYLGNKNQP
jgi:hypothetical protein